MKWIKKNRRAIEVIMNQKCPPLLGKEYKKERNNYNCAAVLCIEK